ncbi:hypothetical protein [Halomonas sp.]|uniref:hypothetical protein n=1 Tax=Halomonas sp. TaxID=1486246 RepID=UPI00298EAA6F|nr:hypothetical protein [Halomonas sp.]MDW7749009.1 hypothetical protein [Halomonas sp.]
MKPEHTTEGFDVENILAELEADRNSGILPLVVTKSAIRYGIDPDDPDRLVAVDAHGRKQDI